MKTWLKKNGVFSALLITALAGIGAATIKSEINDATHELLIEQNAEDIQDNADNVDYLQKTMNVTNNTVTGIQFELKNKPDKEEVRKIFEEEMQKMINEIKNHIDRTAETSEHRNTDITINDPSY